MATVVAAVGAGRWLSLEEAVAELERRRADELSGPAERLRMCGVAAAAARAAAAATRTGLSTVPAGLTAADVRSAGRDVVEAAEVLRTVREAVGARPGYDEVAAGAAGAAQADVEQARLDRAAALPRANTVLACANLAAGALVVGRVVSEAFDRAFLLVAALPLASLGYAAHAVVAPARRARRAARRRWEALRSMNVSTLAGLAALQERAAAWERRAARVTEAETGLRKSRDTWRSLVGGSVALASAERLGADLAAAAALDASTRAADAAWVEAAVALQVAEDTAGAGQLPLVVLDADPEADAGARRLAVQRLAGCAGAGTVVVVTAEPAAADGTAVVDLRQRVRAGLSRLRARTTPPRDPSAPDSVAAEG